ncbi:MAG: iron-containing alcohol dehydrogenase [Desulfarculus sp.]|nr:MAG: iron-containing alcohol dehydrogenase [Desulfarculus sp.]
MDPWSVFQHFNPGKIVCGPDSIKMLPELLPIKDKALLVTDAGVKAAGIVAKVEEALQKASIAYAIYDRVQPDAPIPLIQEAAALYQQEGCRPLIAVGGGSPMDAAKAVGVAVSQPGALLEYASGRALDGPIPFLAAIPTTAGTGSEVTFAAVIADTAGTRKRIIRNPALAPKLALLDPLLLAGLPPDIAAETGADALSHALEGLATRGAQPISDALVLHAIQLIFKYLRPMVGDPSNLEAASNMLVASALASLGWTNAGLGLVHSLAHPLGAHFHVSHGKACALYLPYVMQFNVLAAAPKYRLAAMAMGEDVSGLNDFEAAETAAGAVGQLLDDVGLAQTYEELGIEFSIRPGVVEEILSVPTRLANPRVSTQEQIEELLNAPC